MPMPERRAPGAPRTRAAARRRRAPERGGRMVGTAPAAAPALAAAGPLTDTGLLCPVRAGTPVERAVADEAWLQAALDAQAALARAQAALGALPEEAARTITSVAAGHGLDPRLVAVAARENANPAAALQRAFTAVLAQHDPACARHVRRSTTAQDVFETGAMLVAKRALRVLRGDLEAAERALAALSAAHRTAPPDGRGPAARAVGTMLGLRAAGWSAQVRRARARIESVLDTGLPVVLGGGTGDWFGDEDYATGPGDGLGSGTGTGDGIGGGGRAGIGGDEGLGTVGGDSGEGSGNGEGGDSGGAVQAPDPARRTALLAAAFARECGLAAGPLPTGLQTGSGEVGGPLAEIAAACDVTAEVLGRVAAAVPVLPRGRTSPWVGPDERGPVLAAALQGCAAQIPALSGALVRCAAASVDRPPGSWQGEWTLLRECLRLTGGATHTLAELARELRLRLDPEALADEHGAGGAAAVRRLAETLAPGLGRTGAVRPAPGCGAVAGAVGGPALPRLPGALTPPDTAEEFIPATWPTSHPTPAAAHHG
ncbi:3-carboxy-cis,cis-muconate cycloisomerase [Streptomonospora sp. S1-112]|uniref:3-carboxy-cis,cis-muconate cycloisomerase n=1 Tax=Streptomonospora mangrovi TaxID=2883123 RepID=A0A9X3NIZ9_9ACTN|nr:lyase family protein [Streptomonospora mangrovi]MDA0563935.1 3-carboxy-cis,cis-muconate cycloisomerase [Streptomonospora mangrovi]